MLINREDVIAVLAIPIVSFVVLFFLGIRVDYLQAVALFFLIPSLYLSLRNPKVVKKVGLFTLIATVPLYVIIDLLAYLGRAWVVPASIFPFRIFGILPIEDFIWLFLVGYLILMLYEGFSKEKFDPKLGGRMKLMCAILYPLAVLVIGLFYIYPSFGIPYSFDLLGFGLLLIPAVAFVLKYPSYAVTFLKVQVLFTAIHLLFELVGDKYGYWLYTGTHYVGWIRVLGVMMPVEEMVFVMMFGAFAGCAYYVFFTHNSLKQRKRA